MSALANGRPTSPTHGTVPSLVDLLDLAPQGTDRFVSTKVRNEKLALFGGQVAAQALCAAGLTTAPERTPHSLHCYFLRPGVASEPIVFDVVRDRDGRSYSARRVAAIQDGKVICTLSASFTATTSQDVSAAVPNVLGPEGLPDIELPRVVSFDARRLPPDDSRFMRFWARCTADLPDSPLLHACALTYLSDTNIRSSVIPKTLLRRWGPSLDHSLWFHTPLRLNDWVLTSKSFQAIGTDRALYTGAVHDHVGTLLATISQEILLRPHQNPPNAAQ